jgi:hypothetical protein
MILSQHGIIQSIKRGGGIVTDGLVMHLDAGNTASYPGSGTTWTDLSGNGNNATLTNGPTFDSANGGSIVFDGTNDHATTSYGPQFNDFTIIAWYKSTSVKSFDRIIDKDYVTGTWLGRPFTDANTWGGGVIEPFNPYGKYITLTDGAWHMLASVRQGTTHTIYGDGITNNTSGTVSSAALSNTNFTIAMFLDNPSQILAGNISVIMIYNRALSTSEIEQNFNALKDRYGL